MDIRYKSFVPRSKQDHHFDQIMHNTSNYSQPSFESNYSRVSHSNSEKSTVFADRSPPCLTTSNRKKVNVVTFTPDESNELIARSVIKANPDNNASNGSPINDTNKNNFVNNYPSILRPNQLYEISPEKEDLSINSASKIIAAKRKAAAREILNSPSKDVAFKRKYQLPETQYKRAVSPEILNPEPLSLCSDAFSNNSYNQAAISNNLDEKTKFEIPKLSPPHSSYSKNYQSNITRQSQNYDSFGRRGKPIISFKKSKISYNPRPWQNTLDDDLDEHYKLKSENVIYGQKSQTSNNNHDRYSTYNYSDNDTSLYAQKSDNSTYDFKEDKPVSKSVDKYFGKFSKSTTVTQPVLEHVKEAYECQETGETQDLLDDVEYIIEGLRGNIRPSTKTLSIISLISKCLSFSFRNMLKAHGMLYKIFNYLSDAHLDDSLAMCTAALFLVFSRDKQPRVFHEDSLKLLLKLPNKVSCKSVIKPTPNSIRPNKEHDRVRDRLRLALDKLHSSNSNYKSLVTTSNSNTNTSYSSSKSLSFNRKCLCCRHLKLDNNITAEDIVVECLLQLTTRKTVDWFKNQMCKLGGLDLICEQIAASVEYLGSDLGPQCLDEFVMDRLYKLFNYMRFLEHMTFQNRDNQSYLIDYRDGVLIFNLWRCLKLCAANLSYQVEGSSEKKLIQACLMANLRLLANISHDNEWTSNQLGCCNGLLTLIFSCLLHLPRFMSRGKRFDLSVLALALLINLAEHCSDNRLRMAHITISRKRVACLGHSGQLSEINKDSNNATTTNNNNKNPNVNATNNNYNNQMSFAFDDEPEDEDMDLDDEDEDVNDQEAQFRGSNFINFDCDSTNTKINVLEALVKLFLRHDDRARNNTIIEGDDVPNDGKPNSTNSKSKSVKAISDNAMDEEEEEDDNLEPSPDEDPKWRIIQEKNAGQKRQRKIKERDLSDSEEEDASSDEGADVEFLINSKEEEVELQKKLSAAGQHMQDSVVSAYTALLLGCIIKGSSHFMERIREHLPDGKFKLLAFVLAKFLSILSITSGLGQSGEESILEIVRLLEAQDRIGTDNADTDADKPNSNNSKNGNNAEIDQEKNNDTKAHEPNKLDISVGGGDVLSFSRYCRENDEDYVFKSYINNTKNDDDDDDDNEEDEEVDMEDKL